TLTQRFATEVAAKGRRRPRQRDHARRDQRYGYAAALGRQVQKPRPTRQENEDMRKDVAITCENQFVTFYRVAAHLRREPSLLRSREPGKTLKPGHQFKV